MTPGSIEVVIAAAARTPLGGFRGAFKDQSATQLGCHAIRAALARSALPTAGIEQVFMGCALPAGTGQAPTRQAALGAGVDLSAPCTTVSKVCGSGMQAAIFAHDAIRAGTVKAAVAGGMESMSNAPFLLDKAGRGPRLRHGRLVDHMVFDGLEDAYEKGRLMGSFAEDCASHYGWSRTDQDEFAIASLTRAQEATKLGHFAKEVVPVELTDAEPLVVDEKVFRANIAEVPELTPVFRPDGTITAANSCTMSDGAAALVLMDRREAEWQGIAPLAVIRGHTSHAQAPSLFTMAPIAAIRKLVEKIDWSMNEVDLFEINEAYAVVVMAAIQELRLDHERVNPHGGARALGHPIGASGARILVTLIHALRQHGLRRGIAALGIGGGEATAMAIEIV
jgi:acetyl-CoA C-acetyltransferase